MNPNASVYLPKEFETIEQAVKPVKVAVIGAHQDDIPIMYAPAGAGDKDRPILGITVTDGAGSGNKGPYSSFSKSEMARIRQYEQIAEAAVGNYNAQFQLTYTSPSIGGRGDADGSQRDDLTHEIYNILMMSDQLDEIYVHNPFDKHQSHNAVTRATIEAIRMMPEEKRPKKLIGCEVWRGLDWLPDSLAEKHGIDVTKYVDTMKRGLSRHDSQVRGSKGYIAATEGRYRAGATYRESHIADTATAVSTAVDMTELITNPSLTLEKFEQRIIDTFEKELLDRAKKFEPREVQPDCKGFQAPQIIRGDKLFDVVLPKTIVDIRSKFEWENDDLFESYKDLVRAIVKNSDRSKIGDQAKANIDLAVATNAFAAKLGDDQTAKKAVRDIIKIVRTTIAQVKGEGLGL